MEISCHLFMPLLTELGLWEMGPCYKHVAPNGAFVLQRQLLKKPSYLNTPSSPNLGLRLAQNNSVKRRPDCFSQLLRIEGL
jgi:hypothetical protein